MYQALYRKYRPTNLDEVVGQKVIVKTLKNAIEHNLISHAYLFCGPRGTGKTSIAKILAKTVNCTNIDGYLPCNECVNCTQFINKQSVDIIEIDAASNNGVDQIRELRDKVGLVPSSGKYKVYIIDEVHMLTTSAFNALLKTLEEPPKHVIFILATTEPYKIPITILSRCQRFDFKRIAVDDIVKYLSNIANKEKIDISDDILHEIALLSDGGMRDSISLLDQVNAYTGGKISLDDVHDVNGTLMPSELSEMVLNILGNNLKEVLIKVDSYNDEGKNMVKVLEELITFFRNVLIIKIIPDYYNKSEKENYLKISECLKVEKINKIIKAMNDTLLDMKNSNNPKILFDLLVLNIYQLGNNDIVDNDMEFPKNNQNISHEIIKSHKNVDKNINEELNEKNNYKNVDKENDIVKETLVKQEKTVDKKSGKNLQKNLIKDNKFKEIRINNTLATFDKTLFKNMRDKLDLVRNYILDIEYNFVASLVVDGILKAAGNNYLVFVYNSEHDSELFNENVSKIEGLFEKIYGEVFHVISTDNNDWEIIRDEFNNKKKEYKFIEEDTEVVETQLSEDTNEIEDDFGKLISVE